MTGFSCENIARANESKAHHKAAWLRQKEKCSINDRSFLRSGCHRLQAALQAPARGPFFLQTSGKAPAPGARPRASKADFFRPGIKGHEAFKKTSPAACLHLPPLACMACFMKEQKQRLGKITLRRVIKKHDRLQAASRRIVICHGILQRLQAEWQDQGTRPSTEKLLPHQAVI